jgi:hypothetical protein
MTRHDTQCEDVQSRYEEPLNEADFREVRDILELKYGLFYQLSVNYIIIIDLFIIVDER